MNLERSAVLYALALTFVCCLMIFGTSRVAAAATLTVGNPSSAPCTGTYPTISAAVAAAAPGDTIKVCQGSYHELVNVNKTLIIQGAQSGVDARLGSRTGLPSTESVVDGTAGTTSFYVTANDVTIDGFTVQGATSPNVFGAGIVLGAGTAGAHVINSIIQQNLVGLFLANNSTTDKAVVQRNLFRDNNQPGPASGAGIYTDQFVSGGTLTNVLIDSNKFAAHQDAGIDFSSTQAGSQSNITMSNNNFDGNARAFFILHLTSSAIVANLLQNSTEPATADIRIFGGVSGLSISCNVLQNGTGRAIRVGDGLGGNPNSSITINDNNISGYPIGLVVDSGSYSGGPGSLNSKNDWWGSATGPTIASNPGGTGESIVDPDGVVVYSPFRKSPQGIPCPTPPSEEDCLKAVEQRKDDFEAQQKADKKLFNSQPHTKREKKTFEEQQEAAREAFEKQNKADRRRCEQLGDKDNDKHDKGEKDDKGDKHDH